jgi:hypothetical protein
MIPFSEIRRLEKKAFLVCSTAKHCFKCHDCCPDDHGAGSLPPHNTSKRKYSYGSHFTYDDIVGKRQSSSPTVYKDNCRIYT